nr:E3 ubiquitin-protein ligase RNF4 isoform X2 [Vicugna pacos]
MSTPGQGPVLAEGGKSRIGAEKSWGHPCPRQNFLLLLADCEAPLPWPSCGQHLPAHAFLPGELWAPGPPFSEEEAGSSQRIVEERRRPRRTARRLRQDQADSCVVSSDEEELSRDRDVYVTTHTPRNAREEAATGPRPSGTVSCPICMDGYSEIVQNGRLIVSTECGHVFCSQCLRDSLKNANTCPTCRKKINHKRYHPIYI